MVKTNCILGMGVGDGSGLESIQIIFDTHTCKGKFLPFNETKYLFIKIIRLDLLNHAIDRIQEVSSTKLV